MLMLVHMLTVIMQVQKKKIWEAVQPRLKTNEQKQVGVQRHSDDYWSWPSYSPDPCEC